MHTALRKKTQTTRQLKDSTTVYPSHFKVPSYLASQQCAAQPQELFPIFSSIKAWCPFPSSFFDPASSLLLKDNMSIANLGISQTCSMKEAACLFTCWNYDLLWSTQAFPRHSFGLHLRGQLVWRVLGKQCGRADCWPQTWKTWKDSCCSRLHEPNMSGVTESQTMDSGPPLSSASFV